MNEQEQPSNMPPGKSEPQWERDVLNRLAFAAVNEQRRARRWSILFKSLGFLYLFLLLFIFASDKIAERGEHLGKHTALIDLQGEITDGADTSSDNVISGLRAAFEDENTVGIILRVNSPGGSPVQSGDIYDEIRRLRAEYKEVPVYAVVTDICASGCYYIAAGADAIYANRASLVGSIGVISNGFGFVSGMEKLGVERRLYTAGENKGFLDPFSPERPAEVAHWKQVLAKVHEQFIKAVKDGRGARLKDNPQVFTGLIWTGEEAVALGLVDGLGNIDFVAREVVGVEEIVDFTPQQPYFDRVFDRFGASVANAMTERFNLQFR